MRFLFARAMEHDSPKLLFTLACEFLISERVMRPGVVHLLEHVATARERARRETWLLLVPQVSKPARWAGYVQTAAEAGDVTAYRHYWELCVLLSLRDGLRCGDVFVPGSRRYAEPASFLLTSEQ